MDGDGGSIAKECEMATPREAGPSTPGKAWRRFRVLLVGLVLCRGLVLLCVMPPFEGWDLAGFSRTTLSRGEVIVDGYRVVGSPGRGKWLARTPGLGTTSQGLGTGDWGLGDGATSPNGGTRSGAEAPLPSPQSRIPAGTR